MFLTCRISWYVPDRSTGLTGIIPPGRHEVERVHFPGTKEPWIVLKGSSIGAVESFFRQYGGLRYDNFENGQFKITIEE